MIAVLCLMAAQLPDRHASPTKKAEQKKQDAANPPNQTIATYNQVSRTQDKGEKKEEIEIERQLAKFTWYLVIIGGIQCAILFGQGVLFFQQKRIMAQHRVSLEQLATAAENNATTIQTQARIMGDQFNVMQGQLGAIQQQSEIMKESVAVSKEAASAARASAEGLTNSERAWVLADLGWYEKGSHIIEGTSRSRGKDPFDSTTIYAKLTYRNEGRSPAWIGNVSGKAEIVNVVTTTLEDSPDLEALETFGPMGPIGAGQADHHSLELTCDGHRKEGEFLSIYVLITYRDIFGTERRTSLGYSIDPAGEFIRQDGMPERNQNT